MTYRIETRTVALADADWRLGDAPWKLPDDRSDAMLQLVESPGDLASAFVPDSPPLPLQSRGDAPVARGVALPWNTWTTISERAAAFRERFSPGAFRDTLRNRNYPVAALSNHGQGPAGYMPLGKLALWESARGLEYELAFLSAPYALDVAEGVAAGLFGASVRFSTHSERVRRAPGRSAENPHGLEERTITAASLTEVSLTSFPAYSGTSAALTG